MVKRAASAVLQLLGRLPVDPRSGAAADEELLGRFLAGGAESAFEALLRRHGPMVLDVCRSFLANEADAEDAFQATFLILTRQAGGIREPASLACWLHGVARRVALRAREGAALRRKYEARAPGRDPSETDGLSWAEVRRVVHEEVANLSRRLREPLLLCHLQGRTHDEAAARLGLSKGTLKRRLERGRALLRGRLSRRGLGPEAPLLASAWPTSGVPEALLGATAGLAGGQASARVAALTEAVLSAVPGPRVKPVAAALAVTALFAAGLAGLLPPPRALVPEPRPLPAGDGKPREVAVLRGHTNAVWSVALTREGRTLVSGSFDKTVRVWDVATGKDRLKLRGHAAAVEFVAVTPDGKSAASADQGGGVKAWDLTTGKARYTFANKEGRPRGLFLAADGRALTAGWHGGVKQWDLTTGRELAALQDAESAARTAVRPDGKLAARNANVIPTVVRLLELPSGQEVAAWRQSDESAKPLAFSPDGKTLFLHRARAGAVELLEAATGQVRATRQNLVQRHIGVVAVHPGGRVMAIPREDARAVRLIDLATGEACGELKVDNDEILSIIFSADGNTLAASEGPDSAVRVWDVSGVHRSRPPLKEKLSERDLEALWADLAGADAGRAYLAVWTLAGATKQSAPWLGRHLPPVVTTGEAVTTPLLAGLDHDRQAERDRATRRLEELGESVSPALEKALASGPSAEVRRRVAALLARLEKPGSPGRLRMTRAVEALERAGTREARQVLEKLAGGAPQAARTREAKAAVERLSRLGPGH